MTIYGLFYHKNIERNIVYDYLFQFYNNHDTIPLRLRIEADVYKKKL